jgi:hypothetical protein
MDGDDARRRRMHLAGIRNEKADAALVLRKNDAAANISNAKM